MGHPVQTVHAQVYHSSSVVATCTSTMTTAYKMMRRSSRSTVKLRYSAGTVNAVTAADTTAREYNLPMRNSV